MAPALRVGEQGAMEEALEVLLGGGVLLLPTDTVYGLATRSDNTDGIQRIYELKGRPDDKRLQLLVHSVEAAAALAEGGLGDSGERLARKFWPGGLTLVVPTRAGFQSAALAGGPTVGLRVPDQPFTLELLRRAGLPVAATSANRSGTPSPRYFQDAREQVGDSVDILLDGGSCKSGLDSTVVELSGEGWKVLREGAIPAPEIAAALA
jgi:L-threonylcarbamoyladenylate synthase